MNEDFRYEGSLSQELDQAFLFGNACEKLAETSPEVAELVRRHHALSDESQEIHRRFESYFAYVVPEVSEVLSHNASANPDDLRTIDAPTSPNFEQFEARQKKIDAEMAEVNRKLETSLKEAGMWPLASGDETSS